MYIHQDLRSFSISPIPAVNRKNRPFSLTVKIVSTGPGVRLVENAHCSIQAKRSSDNQAVDNGSTVAATTYPGHPGNDTRSATVEFHFDDLTLRECGDFYYEVWVFAYRGTEPSATTLLLGPSGQFSIVA